VVEGKWWVMRWRVGTHWTRTWQGPGHKPPRRCAPEGGRLRARAGAQARSCAWSLSATSARSATSTRWTRWSRASTRTPRRRARRCARRAWPRPPATLSCSRRPRPAPPTACECLLTGRRARRVGPAPCCRAAPGARRGGRACSCGGSLQWLSLGQGRCTPGRAWPRPPADPVPAALRGRRCGRQRFGTS